MQSITLFALASTLAVTAPLLNAQSKPDSVSAAEMVALFEKLGGSHPGHRKAHARGVCAAGTFSPEQSDTFAGAPLLNNGERPVMLRFSVGGGNPQSDERTPGTRGAGIQISLPGGAIHNFTGNNFPVFAGKDPETFFGFLSTLLPDENGKRDPAKTMAYIQANPSVQANAVWNQKAETSASYANTEFFGLHTFYYQGKSTEKVKFRWHLTPDLGVKTLDKEKAAAMPNDFLKDTLAEQLKSQTVSYTLSVSIGQPEDSDIDPSSVWPKDREQVTLGKITLNSSGGEACTPINFDPNVLSAGFTPSADPVLRMRSPAYAISFGKRLSNQ